MKKKFFKIIIFNILAIFLILMISEIVIWQNDNRILHQSKILDKDLMIRFHPGIKNFELTEDNFPNPRLNYGRNPVGLEYQDKKPIVIFGCSYAYGYLLDENQTFPYKLSHMAQRPVYNRALTGWGIQHMLYQTEQEYLYNLIPEPEYVIYVFIDDHLRRLYLLHFDEWNRAEENFYLRYKEKNEKLIEINNQNFIYNQIKRLYIVSKLQSIFVKNWLNKEKNYKKSQDFALKMFLKSRENMQSHWKDTKYVVYFYGNYKQEYLMEKLKENGFIVFSSEDITTENVFSPEYRINNDFHPNERAWDLLTPLVIQHLNL